MCTLRQPTDVECEQFYYGLPSQPKLVARSSSTPRRFIVNEWTPEPKILTVVGEHEIVAKWNDEPSSLQNQVLDILTQQKVQWQAVDVLRIGYIGEEMPVTLFISVAPNTLSWKAGDEVARLCRSALLDHGLNVHCEIKESTLANLTSTPAVLQQSLHDHPPKFHSYMYELSDQMGTSIATLDNPNRVGTKCLYLRSSGGDPNQVFALTCRHVCYGEEEKGNRLPGEETLPAKPVIHLPDRIQQELVKQLKGSRHAADKEISAQEKRAEACDDGRRSQIIARLRGEQEMTEAVLKHFDSCEVLENKVFGNVAYSRDYGVRDPPSYLSDWCLIQLQADRHERDLSALSNRVCIDGTGLQSRFGGRVSTIEIQTCQTDLTIQIRGILAVSELLHPRGVSIVGMRGSASGLRFGLFNQVKSVVRRISRDGEPPFSRECCIVADSKNPRDAFSQHGDSGACVFNLEGRAVGMVTAGIGREEVLPVMHDYGLKIAVDVTYASPMEWILEDMRACGLCMAF